MADADQVIMTGATGLIGQHLSRALMADGLAVVVFTRDTAKARRVVPGAADYVTWDPAAPQEWAPRLEGAWGVVNLAGASVAGRRWTPEYKAQIRASRVNGTRALVDAMSGAARKPRVLVNASAVGYYGPRDDTPLDEGAAPGSDFLATVVRTWEAEAMRAEDAGVRTVVVRSSVVLDGKEGALPRLVTPFRFFAGGPILPGSQWLSWVHVRDEVGIFRLALENARARGPINATAPTPQTNRDFTRTLGRVLSRPALLPVPGIGLRLLVGEFAGTLTTGQRVIPRKAQELGYQFEFERSEDALRDILRS